MRYPPLAACHAHASHRAVVIRAIPETPPPAALTPGREGAESQSRLSSRHRAVTDAVRLGNGCRGAGGAMLLGAGRLTPARTARFEQKGHTTMAFLKTAIEALDPSPDKKKELTLALSGVVSTHRGDGHHDQDRKRPNPSSSQVERERRRDHLQHVSASSRTRKRASW